MSTPRGTHARHPPRLARLLRRASRPEVRRFGCPHATGPGSRGLGRLGIHGRAEHGGRPCPHYDPAEHRRKAYSPNLLENHPTSGKGCSAKFAVALLSRTAFRNAWETVVL